MALPSAAPLDQAIARLSADIKKNPREYSLFYTRADAYLMKKWFVYALGDLLHALMLNPSSVPCLLKLSTVYLILKMEPEASRTLGQCIRALLRVVSREYLDRLEQQQMYQTAGQELILLGVELLHLRQEKATTEGSIKDSVLLDLIDSPGMFRAYKDGPRHPAVVIAAFTSLLKNSRSDLARRYHKLIKAKAIEEKGGGVGIVTKRRLPANTNVLLDSGVLRVSISPPDLRSKDCYHCIRMTSASAAVPCRSPACDRVYCSRECEEAAWVNYHSPLCACAEGKAVSLLEEKCDVARRSNHIVYYLLFMWKMLGHAMVLAQQKGEPLQCPTDIVPFCYYHRRSDYSDPNTPGHMEARRVSKGSAIIIFLWTTMRDVLGNYQDDMALLPCLSMEWASKAYSMLVPNVIQVSRSDADRSMERAGQMLLGFGELFNHSCTPNVGRVSSMEEQGGGALLFRTTKEVLPGQELNITYWDASTPVHERRLMIFMQYGFECKCPRCMREMRLPPASPKEESMCRSLLGFLAFCPDTHHASALSK